jgi:methyltransferase
MAGAAIAGLVGLVVGIFMLVEARRAAHHERRQRALGGREPAGDVYNVMQVAYPGAFLAMIAEAALREGRASGLLFAAGLASFAAGKALKWWAILTLGPAWTFRVIVVPGAPLISSGPYRYLRHPNYLGVLGELAGVALMTGARIAGPVATIVFGLLMLKRISVERRALADAADLSAAGGAAGSGADRRSGRR